MPLTEIVGKNLGILIEPTQVRLITSADDPYAWKVLPEKEHLFKKHMNKLSIGAYDEKWVFNLKLC